MAIDATTTVSQATLDTLLQDRGLEYLRPTIKPARNLWAATPERRSRLGGHPDLPEGHPWPVGKHGELTFLGQLDLAELDGGTLGLPSKGLLSLFYDTVHQPSPGSAPDLVILHLDSEDLHRTPVPPDSAGEEFDALPVAGAPTWTVRLGAPVRGTEDAWLQLMERLDPRQTPMAWLGGQAYPFQDAMEAECSLVHPTIPPDGWGLVLQIDSDFIPDVRWGSGGGRLYVFAPTAAMRVGDFRSAVAFVQDT